MSVQTRNAEERLERIVALQGLLAEVSRNIGAALELGPVLATVLDAMRTLVTFRGASICLVDEGYVRVAAAHPPVGDELLKARVAVGTGIVGRVVTQGRTIYSPDIDADPSVDPELRQTGSNREMRSFLAVPLVCLGRVIGCLQVDSVKPDAFDPEDIQVLEGLATQVAGAIESAKRHEQMVDLERLKSDLIARISHELRTPLTIVSGFTATVLANEDRLSSLQRRDMLERIRSATARLESIVDEVITVAGYEAGVVTPVVAAVRAEDVLQAVRDATLDPSRVEIRCPDDLVIRTDRRFLQHALGLVVDNALKYAGDALVEARRADGGIVLDVVDHGPGIPAHVKEHVFERFTRGHETTPGAGLGLPLARLLAGSIGGTIDLIDPPGGGTCFRLRLA